MKTEASKSCKIDFLSFTTRRPLVDVLALFSRLPQRLEPKESGLYGYKLSYVSPSGVSVLYSACRDDVHVQLSGEGCGQFEFTSLLGLIAPGDTCSRLDIALDCMNAGYTCADIWGYLQQGQYVAACKPSSIRQIEGLVSRPECNGRKDHTIYIGSSSADRMVRIYDKGAEQQTGNDWLRYEVQLRRSSADRFFFLIAQSPDRFTELCCGLLNKQVRIITPDSVKHKKHCHYDRMTTQKYWYWLTDSQTGFNLQVPVKVKKACNLLRYVKHSAAAMKALKGAMNDFEDWIHDAIDCAVLKPHHKQIQDELAHPDSREVSYMEIFPMNFQECY